jgi:hypothetical protein
VTPCASCTLGTFAAVRLVPPYRFDQDFLFAAVRHRPQKIAPVATVVATGIALGNDPYSRFRKRSFPRCLRNGNLLVRVICVPFLATLRLWLMEV